MESDMFVFRPVRPFSSFSPYKSYKPCKIFFKLESNIILNKAICGTNATIMPTQSQGHSLRLDSQLSDKSCAVCQRGVFVTPMAKL